MSTNLRQDIGGGFPPLNDFQSMMDDFGGMTGEQIELANRRALNLQLTKFMFHAWAPLRNTYVGGVRGNIKYRTLGRLSLIPLYPWPYKKIVNRTTGNISGDIISGSVKVGTKQVPMTKSVEESEKFIVKAYGKMSGIRALNSLTTTDDEGRREAWMLFHAAMETCKPKSSDDETDQRATIRGVDCLLEDLVDDPDGTAGFIRAAAPVALRHAIEHGVRVPDHLLFVSVGGRVTRSDLFPEEVYRFGPGAQEKGVAMLREILEACKAAYKLAVGPGGVLTKSRNQITAAEKGQVDSKMQQDDLDIYLSVQCPSFAWNTPVDRMREANAPMLKAFEKFTVNAQQQPPANDEEKDLLREQNALLAQAVQALQGRLEKLEDKVASPAAAPSDSTAGARAGNAKQRPR